MRSASGRDDRLARHLRDCLAEAEKKHTDEELFLAELALSDAPSSPQPSLFTPAATREVMPPGQPNSPARRQGPYSSE